MSSFKIHLRLSIVCITFQKRLPLEKKDGRDVLCKHRMLLNKLRVGDCVISRGKKFHVLSGTQNDI